MAELTRLQRANRRADRQHAEQLLAQERDRRTEALSEAAGIEHQAAHWIDVKKHLPDEVQQMDRDYRAIHGFETAPLLAVVQKAETDWPQKKADLDARVAAIKDSVAQSETVWQKSADARRAAAANDFAHLDFGALIGAEETLHRTAESLPRSADEIKALSGQLYTSWDKLLVDMRSRTGAPTSRSSAPYPRTIPTPPQRPGRARRTSAG